MSNYVIPSVHQPMPKVHFGEKPSQRILAVCRAKGKKKNAVLLIKWINRHMRKGAVVTIKGMKHNKSLKCALYIVNAKSQFLKKQTWSEGWKKKKH
jgi:hypothetical protein